MNRNKEKHEIIITILSIITYLILNLLCINKFGLTNYKTTIINLILSIIILIYIKKNNQQKYYGLTKITNYKKYLYYFPLILIISVNLWTGININNTPQEIIFYILSMLLIGFLEEIIFRGFLFKMMEKDNLKIAILVTSLTFGFGHIINLLNGSELVKTLIQICYATTTGYLFVIIFYKSKSLLPCIITHSLVNALSIFNIENFVSTYISPIFLISVSITYSIYINKKIKE